MLKQLVATILLSAVTATAFAGHNARLEAKQTYDLKDGATLYVFQDGKMALENKIGFAVPLQKGSVLESRDGQKITAGDDSFFRLSGLLDEGHNSSE